MIPHKVVNPYRCSAWLDAYISISLAWCLYGIAFVAIKSSGKFDRIVDDNISSYWPLALLLHDICCNRYFTFNLELLPISRLLTQITIGYHPYIPFCSKYTPIIDIKDMTTLL